MEPIGLLTRYDAVKARIVRAAREAGRAPDSVQLVVASKTQSAETIRVLLEAGHRVFGENRVQEAQSKWPELKEAYPDVKLHLIGPLQTNKVRDALALFDVIETVDRERLAQAISNAKFPDGKSSNEKSGGHQQVGHYIEVNTGEEAQKAGVLPGHADEFIAFCRTECGLEIEGLMCIPPADHQASPHFALLAQIAARNRVGLLSMGMTADFPLAIQLGATHVRVGTAIFGERQAPA